MSASSSARSSRPGGAKKAGSSKAQPAKARTAKAPSSTAQVAKTQPSKTASARPAGKSKAAAAAADEISARTSEAPAAETGPETTARPLPVLIAAALTGLFAAVFVAYGTYLVIDGITGQPVLRGRAEVGGVIFLVLGLGIAWAARGLGRLQPWARTPAMITLLMPLGVAYWMHQGGMNLWAVIALLVGLGGPALLFVPSAHRVLSHDVHY